MVSSKWAVSGRNFYRKSSLSLSASVLKIYYLIEHANTYVTLRNVTQTECNKSGIFFNGLPHLISETSKNSLVWEEYIGDWCEGFVSAAVSHVSSWVMVCSKRMWPSWGDRRRVFCRLCGNEWTSVTGWGEGCGGRWIRLAAVNIWNFCTYLLSVSLFKHHTTSGCNVCLTIRFS